MFFLNGRFIEAIRESIAQVTKQPRDRPKPLGFAMLGLTQNHDKTNRKGIRVSESFCVSPGCNT